MLILIYFIVQFLYTQKIYTFNYFPRLLLFGLIFLVVSVFFTEKINSIIKVSLGLLMFYYSGLLFLIKKLYKRINALLIARKYLNNKFLDKDFTYVHWNSKNPTSAHWWDEKLALSPSWFDKLLSVLLLLLPFSIFWFINFCFERINGSIYY